VELGFGSGLVQGREHQLHRVHPDPWGSVPLHQVGTHVFYLVEELYYVHDGVLEPETSLLLGTRDV
jgi:hypothetical protein